MRLGRCKVPVGLGPRKTRTSTRSGLRASWLPLGVALIALCALFTAISPGHVFFSVTNLASVATDMTETGIMAVGATFILAAGGIDLSVGGVLAFSSILGGRVMANQTGAGSLAAGLALMVITGAACGTVNGLLIEKLHVPAFIATLGTLGITVGGGYLLSNGVGVAGIPTSLQNDFGVKQFGGWLPGPVLVLIAVGVVAAVVLMKTRFGCYTLAIGSNREAADRAGIRVRRHVIKIYVLAGALAGLAGVIDVARFGSASVSAHQTDVLPVISAVVIGGTSLFGGVATIVGTLIGAALLSVLTNGLVITGLQPFWQQIATGAILIVAVLFDQYRDRFTVYKQRRAPSGPETAGHVAQPGGSREEADGATI